MILPQVSAKEKLKTKEIITPNNIHHCFHQCPLARMFRYKVSVLKFKLGFVKAAICRAVCL